MSKQEIIYSNLDSEKMCFDMDKAKAYEDGWLIPIKYKKDEEKINLFIADKEIEFTNQKKIDKIRIFVEPKSNLASLINDIQSFIEDEIVSECFDKLIPKISSKHEEISKLKEIVAREPILVKVEKGVTGVFDKEGKYKGGQDTLPLNGKAFISLWVRSFFLGNNTITLNLVAHQVVITEEIKRESIKEKLLLDLSKLKI